MAIGPRVELLRHWVAPVPRHLSDMGYVREQRNLQSRSRRCRTDWQPHLLASRALILEAAAACRTTRKALIVGSGPLFDVPIAELSRQFREVVLADILHPGSARYQVRRHPNVRLIQIDVTGAVENVYALCRSGRALAPPVHKPNHFLCDGFDLVVSANSLSQLPVLPNAYAAKRMKNPAPDKIRTFSRALVEQHLDWLSDFPGQVCLIADMERLTCDGLTVVHREGSLWDVQMPDGGREWTWDLAPRPEIDLRFDIRHRVIGFATFPKAAWRQRMKDATDGQWDRKGVAG